MKETIQALLLTTVMLIIIILFFCPIIISLLTGNWWFMFLFMVSWIPTVGVAILAVMLLETFEK